MTAKSQTNWPPEILEEWARPVLAHSELVEIARTATSNNEAKNKALVRVTKTREDLAQACRWLRILRVKYPARFEKLISRADQNQKQEEKKMGEEEKVFLYANEARIRTWKGKDQVNLELELRCDRGSDLVVNAMNLLTHVEGVDFDAMDGIVPTLRNDFRDKMIQILEEKYGLPVKICAHCDFWKTDRELFGNRSQMHSFCTNSKSPRYNSGIRGDDSCRQWNLKEVSEEKK